MRLVFSVLGCFFENVVYLMYNLETVDMIIDMLVVNLFPKSERL